MEQELEQVLEQGAVRQGNMVTLDVRPHLHKKLEPFKLIMDTVKTLNEDDIFVLHATFKPTPLLGVLKLRGYVNKVEKIEKDHWITTFVNEDFNHLLQDSAGDLGLDDANNFEQDDSKIDHSIGSTAKADPSLTASVTDSNDRRPNIIELDNRGLQPPQPMMRTLAALDRSRPGDEVRIHNDRVPVFLIEELNALGHTFTVEEQPDGTAKAKIIKR